MLAQAYRRSISSKKRVLFSQSHWRYGTIASLVLCGLGAGALHDWRRKDATLDSEHFSAVSITDSIPSPCDPSSKLLKLFVPCSMRPVVNPTAIWSLYIKDDELQIERPFTPITGLDSDGHINLWVRKYADSEVSRWLCNKKPGDKIEVRGPVQTLRWPQDTSEGAPWDEILLISGGTGITPFMQLLHSIFNNPQEELPHITLLHSSRTPAQLPPMEIMKPLLAYAESYPTKFRVQLFVDSESDNAPPLEGLKLKQGRITRGEVAAVLKQEAQMSQQSRLLVVICGPEQMVCALAGPRVSPVDQGPIGGVLASLGFTSKNVQKL